MKYIRLSDSQYPRTLSQIKADNPSISFPKQPTDEQLSPFDYANVFSTTRPTYNSKTQYVKELPPVSDGNQYNQVWGVIDYTQEELDAKQLQKDTSAQQDMLIQGRKATIDDDTRISVSAAPLITDRPAHDSWMQQLYADDDVNIINTPKPPPDERQLYTLTGEDADPFTFTRFQDQWGYRWQLRLTRKEANNLSVGIYDSAGNYLYTIGALIEIEPGLYGGDCPAGQADATPEDVYFKWLLGSADISGLFKYAGDEDNLNGVVKYDSDYD